MDRFSLEPVQSLADISIGDEGAYYWDFPEALHTWGAGLRGARLLKLQTELCAVYLRGRVTQGTIASWQGETSARAWQGVGEALASEGFQTLKFQPLSADLKTVLPGGYRGAVWYTHLSWKDMPELSGHRRWQFKRALALYEFEPVSFSEDDTREALAILQTWREHAEKRQMILGVGHYASCIRLHSTLENSRLFFCRRKATGQRVGLVGGYVRDGKAVVVNIKHDYSDKFIIHALWGFWMDYAHRELSLPVSCMGSTSDHIKKRMHMTRQLYYKP